MMVLPSFLNVKKQSHPSWLRHLSAVLGRCSPKRPTSQHKKTYNLPNEFQFEEPTADWKGAVRTHVNKLLLARISIQSIRVFVKGLQRRLKNLVARSVIV
jgi:hypothetical protein